MTTRESLHDLLDELPESALSFAERSLQRLKAIEDDPFLQSLANAPIDDEPTTPEDLAAIEAGRRSMREGRGLSDEDLDALLARHTRV